MGLPVSASIVYGVDLGYACDCDFHEKLHQIWEPGSENVGRIHTPHRNWDVIVDEYYGWVWESAEEGKTDWDGRAAHFTKLTLEGRTILDAQCYYGDDYHGGVILKLGLEQSESGYTPVEVNAQVNSGVSHLAVDNGEVLRFFDWLAKEKGMVILDRQPKWLLTSAYT